MNFLDTIVYVMGIKYFYKIFQESSVVEIQDITGSSVVVDAHGELCRALCASQAYNLSSSSGTNTGFISDLLYNVIQPMIDNSIRQYWVFDASRTTALKDLERVKRKSVRDKNLLECKLAEERLALLDEDDVLAVEECKKIISKRKARGPEVTSDVLYLIQAILQHMAIPYVVTPDGFEADQICAAATYDERIFGEEVDYVMSMDSDMLVFGARQTLKKKNKSTFSMYVLDDILDEHKINLSDLVRISVHLGSDFAPGTKGIGPKRALSKKDSVLTREQQDAVDHFMTPVPISLIAPVIGKKDTSALVSLLNSLDFNINLVRKKLHLD
jgi:flap endonuclease-1